jgi:hypothetical protein
MIAMRFESDNVVRRGVKQHTAAAPEQRTNRQVTKPDVNSAVLPFGRLPLSKTPERVTLPSDPRESRNVGFSMLVA